MIRGVVLACCFTACFLMVVVVGFWFCLGGRGLKEKAVLWSGGLHL